MSHVGITSAWTLNLTTEEFRLVLKALGGRLGPDDLGAAKAFGDNLTRQRAMQVKQQVLWADRLLQDVGPEEEGIAS